jgi:hypothetical protein
MPACSPTASSCRTSRGRFPLPTSPAQYRSAAWGYVERRGMLGWMKWDDILDDQFDLSGSATRWGINLSSNVKSASSSTLRLQFVFGEGIQNYMNDSPVDVGIVQPGRLRHARSRARRSRSPARAVPRSQLERAVVSTRRLFAQDNDNTEGQAPTPSRTASTRSATSSTRPCRT